VNKYFLALYFAVALILINCVEISASAQPIAQIPHTLGLLPFCVTHPPCVSPLSSWSIATVPSHIRVNETFRLNVTAKAAGTGLLYEECLSPISATFDDHVIASNAYRCNTVSIKTTCNDEVQGLCDIAPNQIFAITGGDLVYKAVSAGTTKALVKFTSIAPWQDGGGTWQDSKQFVFNILP
jgi:hypothetical protein